MGIYATYFQPENPTTTVFECLVMDTSLLVIWHDLASLLDWPELYMGYQAHRDHIEFH